MKIRSIFLCSMLALSLACKKDESGPSGNEGSGKVLDQGVMVLNEGQFLAGNASVTLYNDEGEKSENIFQSINESQLGDVLQSAMETDAHYYLVINNSGKIEVVNKNTFASEATISGFSSPRYICDLENGKALVSNFVFASDTANVAINLDIVDLNDHSITGSISVNNWCEMMHLKGETVYVANTGKNQVLLIDRNSLTVTGSISTPYAPTEILEDKNGMLWVLCEGDAFNGQTAAVVVIDPTKNAIDRQIDFLSPPYPQRIAMNGKQNIVFIMTDKVYRTSVGDTGGSLAPIPNVSGFTYAYSLGIDPETTDIYVGDAMDFVSKGQVKVYDINGNLLRSFQAGVNPTGFLFR